MKSTMSFIKIINDFEINEHTINKKVILTGKDIKKLFTKNNNFSNNLLKLIKLLKKEKRLYIYKTKQFNNSKS